MLFKKTDYGKENGSDEHRYYQHVALDFVGFVIGGVACQIAGKKAVSSIHPATRKWKKPSMPSRAKSR